MKNTLWRNKKNGNVYEVLQEATDCTNARDGKEVFIYQPLDKREFFFVREKEEFFQKFEKVEKKEEAMHNIVYVETELEGAFEIKEGEKLLAELNFKKLSNNRVDAYHTFVDDSLRGQGIAEQLYQSLLAYVKEKGYTIVPTCTYIEKRIQKNTEFLAKE